MTRITPLILTFNESENIGRTLARLSWANRVVVIDSFSTDDTKAIAERFPNVAVVQRSFDCHSNQWNFGLQQVDSPWVLALDADYVLSDEIVRELVVINGQYREPDASSYVATFRYCVEGAPLSASLYPPSHVLFRKSNAHFIQDGHTQRLIVNGISAAFHGKILHDDRKPLSRWLNSQQKYASLEADKLLQSGGGKRSMSATLRRCIIPAAPVVFVYTMLFKRCVFNGWPGLFYALQRTYFEILLSLEILSRKLAGRSQEIKKVESENHD